MDDGSDSPISRNQREANYSEPQAKLPQSLYIEENADSMLYVEEPLKDGWKMLYNGTGKITLHNRYLYNEET